MSEARRVFFLAAALVLLAAPAGAAPARPSSSSGIAGAATATSPARVLRPRGGRPRPAPHAAPQPERPIYKVDSVIATLNKGSILVQVKGAVQSGGWKNPHLRLKRSPGDAHTLVVEFVATPPAPNAPVIQALLPVSAQTVLPRRKGVVAVRAVTDANEMTAQILDSGKR